MILQELLTNVVDDCVLLAGVELRLRWHGTKAVFERLPHREGIGAILEWIDAEVFDSEDADITYLYASRLEGEPSGVDDLHIHPVEPRQLRVSLQYRF